MLNKNLLPNAGSKSYLRSKDPAAGGDVPGVHSFFISKDQTKSSCRLASQNQENVKNVLNLVTGSHLDKYTWHWY
jgi:hypothetical protein